MVSLGWLYLEGYFNPLAPRGRALQAPSSHTCLESAQCWPCPMPLSMHKQMSVCVVQTNTRGDGFSLRPDIPPCVKKGFCSGISIWKIAIHYSVLVMGLIWWDAHRRKVAELCCITALEKMTEEVFFFPYLMLSGCSLRSPPKIRQSFSVEPGFLSQNQEEILHWPQWQRMRGQAPPCLLLSCEILLKLPFQVIPFPGGTQVQIPLVS